MSFKRLICIQLYLWPQIFICAQENSLDSIKINLYEVIESFENSSDVTSTEFNALYEHLEILLNNPLEINISNKDELVESQLFNENEATKIIAHRKVFGGIVDLEELTYLGVDRHKIHNLKPFIVLNQTTLKTEVKWSHELLHRYSRTLDPTSDDSFLGSNEGYLIKYRANQGRKIRLGLTLEKDAGEEFFKGSNSMAINRPLDGFDFSSFHLFIRPGQKISHLAIGDYSVNIGQGLLIWNGFAFGKTALILNAKRQGPTLLPYSSAQENGFMRGAAIRANFKSVSQTLFVSHKKIDANVSSIDSTGDALIISSFQSSGLHRTINELYDESSIGRTTVGSSTRKSWLHGYIQLNALYTHHDTQILFKNDLSHGSYSLDKNTFGSSIDYKITKSKYSLFGESSILQSGATAVINGLELFTTSSTNLILSYRNYTPSYYSPEANAFSDGGTRNEKGLYIGLESSLSSQIQLSSYVDSYRRKWPSSDAPFGFEGTELFGQLRYTPDHTLDMYIRSRFISETSNNTPNTTEKFAKVRFHLNKQLTRNIAIRSRYEWNHHIEGAQPYNGFLLYQDAVFYLSKLKLTTSIRASLFNSRQSTTSSYAFENDLLYSFSVPVYTGQGTRYYAMLKWKPRGKTQYWFRYAMTNTTSDPMSSKVKFQLIYRL